MLKLLQAPFGFFLCILMLVLCYGGAPALGDPDTAWHLAAGDLIRSLHAIPATDPWSFTAADAKWYNLSWLFDVVLSALFARAGFAGILILTVFVFALSVALMGLHCIRRGASPLAVFAAVMLALFVIYGGTLARPHMLSMLLTVVFYCVLHRYRMSGRLRDLLWLPPLMALWGNLHGGFLLAFFLMGLFFMEAVLEGDVKRRIGYRLVIALCLLAILFNPYGFEVFYGAYRTLSASFDQNFIVEWKSVEIGRNIPMTLLLFAMLAVGNVADKRIALIDRMLSIAMLLLALSSMRQGGVAALLVMPYLSLRLTSVLQESRFGPRLRALDDTITADMRRSSILLLSWAFAAGAFALIAVQASHGSILRKPLGFPRENFPRESAEFITKHYPHMHFFNDYNMGGYLVYIWRGSTKVFIDGRASSVYDMDVLEDYPDFAFSYGFGPHAQGIVHRYALDGVITLNEDLHSGYWRWNPRWKLVHHDAVATVYLRSDIAALAEGK